VGTKKTDKAVEAAQLTLLPAPSRKSRKRPGATAASKPARAARSTPKGTRPAGAAAEPHRLPRRAIFIDVENTSREEDLFTVLDGLKIDRGAQSTELTAVGNWRAVGQTAARRLAALGAHLVHSAPARGVRDWSDLWIAVAAGCWLGQARPGDVLEIVSDDRAFDAVGDMAAARGVIYRRLQHRAGTTAPAEPSAARPASGPHRRRNRRPSRRRPTPTRPEVSRAAVETTATRAAAEEPHAASREQMLSLIGRLTNHERGRWVNLDVLERALKAEGFSRPPGSPRLVTRLRMLKDVEVGAQGRVRLAVQEQA
jgi:hypothetical protein